MVRAGTLPIFLGAGGYARSTIFLSDISHSRQTHPVAARIFGMRIRLYAVGISTKNHPPGRVRDVGSCALFNGASSGGVKIRGSRSRAEVKDGESVACGPAQPGNNFSRRAPRSVVTGNYLQNNLSSRGATLLPAPSSPLPNRCPRGRLRALASLVSTLGIDCHRLYLA
jgi:hypothetical protein